MKGTISQRITWGFGGILVLVVIVALVGWWALGSTRDSYERAVASNRDILAPAIQLQGNVASANVSVLRYLLEPAINDSNSRDPFVAEARSLITRLRASSADDIGQRWQRAGELLEQWDAYMERSIDAAAAGNDSLAMAIRGEASSFRRELDALIDTAVENVQQRSDDAIASGRSDYRIARNTLLIGAALALLAGLAFAVWLNGAISRPLLHSSRVLASSAAEILAASTQQAAGANASMAAVSQTVATVDEVAQTADQASQRAKGVAELAQRAAEIGRAGRRSVEDSLTAIDGVKTRVESIADSILALAEQALNRPVPRLPQARLPGQPSRLRWEAFRRRS